MASLLDDRLEFFLQRLGSAALEVFGGGVVAAGKNALGVVDRHRLDRVDQQLLRLGHGSLGGAVHGGLQLVGLLAHAQAAHHALNLLHALGQRDLHLGVAEETILLAEQVDGLAGALGQCFLEAAARVLAGNVGQAQGMGGGSQQQAGGECKKAAHVSFSENKKGRRPNGRRPMT
jgi:hypothetical protein